MLQMYTRWLIRHKYLLVFSTLLLTVLLASGAKNLRMSNDYRVFFGPDNPQLIAFENLQDTYSKSDNILLILAPQDGQVFNRQVLSVVQQLTEDSWQIPYSSRVDSITNFQYTHAEGDDLIVEDLIADPMSLSDSDLSEKKAIALAETLLVDRLISPRAHVTGINVTIQLPVDDQQKALPAIMRHVRQLADDIRSQHPHIAVYITGITAMNNAFQEAAIHDVSSLTPLMFLVVLIAITLLLKMFAGTFATLIVVLVCIASAMGVTGWLGVVLSPPTTTAPTIILTLAVADCVHILSTFRYFMHRGHNREEAMSESLRLNLQPVFLTSLTTAIGFLSMNFSDSPPFHDLGNITAMGVSFAFLFSVSLLPALMLILPVRVSAHKSRASHWMDSLAEFVIRRRTPLFWIMAMLIIGLISLVPRNELNDQFVEYFDDTVAFRVDTDFASENLTGLYIMEFSLQADAADGINAPAFLGKADEFVQWLNQQSEVMHVFSLTDIMKRLNKNMHADQEDWYKLPDDRELAAQYLLLYEMSLPQGLELTNQISIDKSSIRLTVMMHTLTTRQMLDFEAQTVAWLKTHAPDSMHTTPSGPTLIFSHISARNIRSMLIGTALALVLISVILMIALRSVKMGLISLVPNLVPAGMAFGLWAVIDGRVGMALSVVAGLTIGIVVDDTIHFLSKYLRARREQGLSSEDAIRYAFASVGKALWVTTLVLVAGFIVLTFSHFKLNADMGLMTAMTITLALLADFFFLPPLLMLLEQKRPSPNTTAQESNA